MLEQLSNIHQEVIKNTVTSNKRYLYNAINWDAKGICIYGDRGVGKTTLMCQYLITKYKLVDKALYISADNIHVLSNGLFNIAQDYFSLGGQALFIDEVHKYPNWSIELKNILDTYKTKQIIFSASSSLDLKGSKADLSRRVVYHELRGLSFREFLDFNKITNIKPYQLEDVLNNHIEIASSLKDLTILKQFKLYLEKGYYPFYFENKKDYLSQLNNVIEKVISEDIAVVYNLRQNTLPVLKKILWLVSSSEGLMPNIDKISRNLGVSREIIYNSFEYLDRAGLISNVQPKTRGIKLARKPGKVFIDNTNLIYAINTSLKQSNLLGNIRESFFVNQIKKDYEIFLHNKADFILENDLVFEVGGKNKDLRQIQDEPKGYLAVDDIELGFGRKIPLYLFGLLY